MNNKAKRFLVGGEFILILIARLLDAFSGFVLFVLLMGVGVQNPPDPLHVYKAGLIIFILIIIFFHFHNIYRSFRFSTLRYEIRTVFSACFFLFIVLVIIGYITDMLFYLPRSRVISWVVLWPVSMALIRIVFRKIIRFIRIKGYNLKKAVIAGHSMTAKRLAEHIHNNLWSGTQILGFFSDDKSDCSLESSFMHKVACLGDIDDLTRYIKKHRVDIIYISMSGGAEQSMLVKLLKAVENLPILIHYVPNVFFLDLLISGEVLFFDKRPIILLRNTPIRGMAGIIKRFMDIVLSAVALLVLLPFLIVIAIAVKSTSKGPILFIQTRYGMNGQEIKVYKFRTMYENSDSKKAPYVQAKKNDPRVTPLGSFLRKTSLDELPQFINVLQGKMSLVGPRPHPVAMNKQYKKIISGYMVRHKVKPGITGLAQVKGFRGETETLEKMEKRIEYDLRYIREWSILFDIEILIRTFAIFFFQKNAY